MINTHAGSGGRERSATNSCLFYFMRPAVEYWLNTSRLDGDAEGTLQ